MIDYIYKDNYLQICYNINEVFMAKYEVGKIVRGVVSGITDYGIFVRLEDYYNGMIHISEVSYGFVSDMSEVVKVGDVIDATIIEVDDENLQIKLSIKDLAKYKKRKYSRRRIKEVGRGFGLLEDNLEKWINNYGQN